MTDHAKKLLKVDCKAAAEKIEKYIRDAVNEHKASGVIMGLSGGIDSAIMASLAVRSLGKDKVHVYYLHDKNSESDSLDKARLMADSLRLKLNMGNIEERMREKEKEAGFFKFVSSMPTFVLPAIVSLYYIVVGEAPYITILRREELKRNKFKRWIYDHVMKGVEEMFDGPCAERRVVLQEIADKSNLLLIGSGNKSEDLTGWFTPNGVDNMPVSPIVELYKTQVNMMGEYLKIPEPILKRKPSADVLRGADDTLALGMSFEKIDIVLCGIECGLKDEEICRCGVIQSEIDRVREINRLSAWRRAVKKG